MEQHFGMITAEHAWIREAAEGEDVRNTSGIEDELFSGWAVEILEENTKQYVKVETHYGYTGYVDRRELKNITREELVQRQDTERFWRIGISEADLLDQPKVQGLPLELLLKNSIVELLDREVQEGWSQVRAASGRSGYIHTQNLRKRMDSDGYLLAGDTEKKNCFQNWKNPYRSETGRNGEEKDQENRQKEEQWDADAGVEKLRERLTASAREFLGTQYRWGGKSSQGIDCSGLVFMSYLDQGILVYRDAQIMEAYPVKEITEEQIRKGDLIFFPGHVAMYLGEQRYIHATGYVKTPYVTINSLRESDPDYRADLAGKITGYGSIFA